jgi:hypothetical protein
MSSGSGRNRAMPTRNSCASHQFYEIEEELTVLVFFAPAETEQ